MYNRQIQFELWKECNNNCSFCYLGDAKFKTKDEEKILNLKKTFGILKQTFETNTNINYNIVSFIGGEFFQGQMKNSLVKETFMLLIQYINGLLNKGILKQFWVCATLISNNQIDLFEMMKMIDDPSKIWICTSYDEVGRFHTNKMFESWMSNILLLKRDFSGININITSILTGSFIESYLNNQNKLFSFANSNNLAIFLKPPCRIMKPDNVKYFTKQQTNELIPNFFPKRKKFIDFLYKYRNYSTEFMFDKLFNMRYRCDTLYNFANGNIEHISSRIKDQYREIDNYQYEDMNDKCQHSTQYEIYIDSEACCVCDKFQIGSI